MNAGLRIEALRQNHDVDHFECGQPALNRFLARHALQGQRAGSSRTYVGLHEDTIVGYYSLVASEVVHEQAPDRLAKGLARHPIPLMLIARLAVRQEWQGRGIGAGLLRDAMPRTLQAADIVGVRALAVHAKDDAAVSFYSRFGFIPSPVDPLHLFVLLKDVRKNLNKA